MTGAEISVRIWIEGKTYIFFIEFFKMDRTEMEKIIVLNFDCVQMET